MRTAELGALGTVIDTCWAHDDCNRCPFYAAAETELQCMLLKESPMFWDEGRLYRALKTAERE